MNSKPILAGLIAALFALNSYAAGPKGGATRPEEHLALESDYTEISKGDQLVMACKVCDAMSVVTVDSDEMAAQFCEEGKELTCPSCKAKATTHRLDKDRPQPKAKPARNIVYANEHGEHCLIVSRVVSR